MDGFRYSQFCPLARAAEVLGQRWVLPLLRDLFLGPQRFADLRRRMGGDVSSSVLSDRLHTLETHRLVTRRRLPAPAASTVYELTALGQALEPALIQLTRWGALLLGPPRPGDHLEPDWLRISLRAFARSRPSPALHARLEAIGEDDARVAIDVAGGPQGTRVTPVPPAFDAMGSAEGLPVPSRPPHALLCAPVASIMGFLSGALSLAALEVDERVLIRGDRAVLARLSDLFDMPPPTASP